MTRPDRRHTTSAPFTANVTDWATPQVAYNPEVANWILGVLKDSTRGGIGPLILEQIATDDHKPHIRAAITHLIDTGRLTSADNGDLVNLPERN